MFICSQFAKHSIFNTSHICLNSNAQFIFTSLSNTIRDKNQDSFGVQCIKYEGDIKSKKKHLHISWHLFCSPTLRFPNLYVQIADINIFHYECKQWQCHRQNNLTIHKDATKQNAKLPICFRVYVDICHLSHSVNSLPSSSVHFVLGLSVFFYLYAQSHLLYSVFIFVVIVIAAAVI